VPLPAVKGQVRAAGLSIPLGLVLLVGGAAAVALGQRALGVALIAAGVLSPVIGFIILLRVKRATTTAVQADKDQRMAEIDDFLREATEGKDRP
jgi:membrane associated rhomboid family serine protease